MVKLGKCVLRAGSEVVFLRPQFISETAEFDPERTSPGIGRAVLSPDEKTLGHTPGVKKQVKSTAGRLTGRGASFVVACKLTLLGGFALESGDGGKLTLPTRKDRLLLAYLALSAGKLQTRDRLAGLLWGDRAEAQARDS